MTQVPFLMGAEPSGASAAGGLEPLILVAETPEQRSRLLARLGDVGPVLVVSSAEEAQRILGTAHHGGSTQRGSTSQERANGGPERGGGALVARLRSPDTPVAILAAPGLRIVSDRQVLAVAGRETQLTPLEFALFTCLVTELGRVWAFAELSQQVWGTAHVGDHSQVHAVVKRLRRKLNALPAPVGVEAVRGVGFRAVARRLGSALEKTPGR